jgi:hypothetical protein
MGHRKFYAIYGDKKKTRIVFNHAWSTDAVIHNYQIYPKVDLKLWESYLAIEVEATERKWTWGCN